MKKSSGEKNEAEEKSGVGLRRVTQGTILLLLAAAIFFILGKGAAAILDEKVHTTLEEAAARYGLEVKAAGVSFVSLNGLTIRDISVALPGAPPIIQVEAVTVRFHLLDWMLGRPFVSGADLLHPQVTLRRDENGIWELTRIKRPERRSAGEARSSLSSHLEIDISDIEIFIMTPTENVSRLYENASIVLDRPTRMEARLASADESLSIELNRGSSLTCRLGTRNWSPSLLTPFAGRIIDLAAARLTMEGEGTLSDSRSVDARLKGHVENVTIEHALLSKSRADGVGFGFEIDLHGVNNTWLLRRGDVELGGETVAVTGTLATTSDGGKIVNLRAGFEHIDLGRVVAGIPRSLTPRLPDLAATGRLDGFFSLSYESLRPASLDYSFQGTVESFAITGLGPEVDLKRLEGTFEHAVTAPSGETRILVVGPESPNFVAYGRIPRALIGAVLTAEDGSFFSHNGFSPRHIHDAIVANLQAGRVVRGASTISMQLAKNLFLSRERTLSRKIEETFLTMALERAVPKKRLLEIYLNIIEWGPGIYGIGPAARYYFATSPSGLTPLQCAFLASIIARPNRGWGRDPLERIGAGWKGYLHIILAKMYRRGDVTIEQLVEAGVPDTTIRALAPEEESGSPWPLPFP